MNRLLSPSLTLILAFIASSCGSGQPDARADQMRWHTSDESKFSAQIEWLVGPVANEFSTARVNFNLSDGAVIRSIDAVVFDPQMPSMGHGTETEYQKIEPVAGEPGSIIVEGIYFIMGGPWEILLTASVNGQMDRVRLPVDVP